MKRYLTVFAIILTFLTGLTWAQNICQVNPCIDGAGQFTCNNQGCQGFQVYTNQTNFNSSSVICVGGGNSCFYQQTQNTTVITYLLCNYSIANCNACNNPTTCTGCLTGYYQYQYDIINQLSNCQLCSQAIPGCIQCNNQVNCQQCQYQYITNGNQCLFLNGTQVGPQIYYNGGASTAAQIVRSVFILVIMIFILAAMLMFFCKQKKYPDILGGQSTQLSMEEKL